MQSRGKGDLLLLGAEPLLDFEVEGAMVVYGEVVFGGRRNVVFGVEVGVLPRGRCKSRGIYI
jgi:hypothetical protein